MLKRKIFVTPINELSQEEIIQLFKGISLSESFIEKYGKYSISTFPQIQLPIPIKNQHDPYEAFILGMISGIKQDIPKFKLIAVFGAPGCGKSLLIRLVHELNNKTIDEIKQILKDTNINDEEAFKIKQLVDDLVIIPKKTTRPKRESEEFQKPEIVEGISLEEVQACDFKYEYSGNIYGFSKKDIDDASLSGNALMIINDLDTLNDLFKEYGTHLLPLYIYRSGNLKNWTKIMQKSGRTSNEILSRKNSLHKSRDMYNGAFIDNSKDTIVIPEVILNIPEESPLANSKTLLLQLDRILSKKIYRDRIDNDSR